MAVTPQTGTGSPHDVVKPEQIAATAAVSLEEQLVIPAVFKREGIEQYKGSKDDTINVKVDGVLPFRTFGWRADRTTASVQFDEYAEKTVAVQFGGDVYSALRLTDEQNTMDFDGWAKLASKQAEALGRGLEYEAVDHLVAAPYAVTLGGAVSGRNYRKTLIKAREVLNKFRAPGARTLLVGSDWETELLSDADLNLASNVGDDEAATALREATIARRYGFNIVVASDLPPTMAVALVDSAFIFATGAPSVPQSVPFGAAASHNGVALRWIRDYDSEKFQDRSIFNTYKGFREVKDTLIGRDEATGQAFVSTYEHFVRAIKLDLDATADVLPDSDGGPGSTPQGIELAAITGVGVADGAAV